MENESIIRVSVFLTIFVVMATLEALLPARKAVLARKERWVDNLSMVVLGAVVSRLLVPASLAGISLWASANNVGLFNMVSANESAVAVFVAVATSVVLFDIIIYWQHRLFHTVPILWKVHKMHHADSHVDTTTGLRFHPIEIVISLAVKAAAVAILGAPVMAIVIFEVALNGFSLFNHANIRIPQKWDDKLSWFIITQRLHRIHHSQAKDESNSNLVLAFHGGTKYSEALKREPATVMKICLLGKVMCRLPKNASVLSLLLQPFSKVAVCKR